MEDVTGSEARKKLLAMGFRLFPLVVKDGKKLPLVKDYANTASNDPQKVESMFTCPILGTEHGYGIGISTRNLADGSKLIGVDIDDKDGRDGSGDVVRLFLEGKEFPETYTQFTPTGGRHFVYRTNKIIGNSKGRVAPGIDIRGKGGLLVGAGTEVPGKGIYLSNWAEIAQAPTWLEDACQEEVTPDNTQHSLEVNEDYARRRAEAYARSQPGVEKGSRGSTAYNHACWLKDLGVSQYAAFEILDECWAERCSPPMPEEELIVSVENAYRYSKDKQGNAAPENAFPDLEPEPEKKSPVEEMNEHYAFVISGSSHHILWETTDDQAVPIVKHLDERAFHRLHASKLMNIGGSKMEQVTKVWMSSPKRRTYEGFCFRPGRDVDGRFYNFWRGFTVQPLAMNEDVPQEWIDSVNAFLEHAMENVCHGDENLFRWLMGYFAHSVQRPWEKPLVALVFQGKKGVGKSALVERVGYLFGSHAWSVADQRYLTGNFNSHLEQSIYFTLEEAFWSGDKKIDGILKNLITGRHHVIEHKGQEPYKVDNCTRVVIIGNEDWLVPATAGERRYAVFKVGDKRRRDNKFFEQMRLGMEAGGYRLLLQYFMDFDLSTVDINTAPDTPGLVEQKLHNGCLVQKWWMESLAEGEISDSELTGWPSGPVSKKVLRDAFARYSRRMSRAMIPDSRAFGHMFLRCGVSLTPTKAWNGDEQYDAYRIPDLRTAREEFEESIEGKVEW